MKKEVLLIRHPEIERGEVPKCYGHTDLSLTPRGVEMIVGLLNRARGWQPEIVLSSDLKRCLQPAKEIAETCGTACEVDPAWREIFMGEWENVSWEELKSKHPESMECWKKDYVTVCAPGGESYDQLAERTFGALRNLEQRPEKRIWVMTHGGVIRAIVSRILGLSLEKSWAMETAYASGVLVRWNDENWKVIFT